MNMDNEQVRFAAADERDRQDQSTMVTLLSEMGVPLRNPTRLEFPTIKSLFELLPLQTFMAKSSFYAIICNVVACMTHCVAYDATVTEADRIQAIKAYLQSIRSMTVPLVSFYNGMDTPAMDAYALKLVLRIYDQASLLSYHDRMEPSQRIDHVSHHTQIRLWNALNSFPLFVRSTRDLLTQFNYNEHLNEQLANLLLKFGFTQAEIAYVLSSLFSAQYYCLADFKYRLLRPDTNTRFIARERRLILAQAINFMARSGQHPYFRILHFDFSAFMDMHGYS